jgi:hypothetical protein
MIGQIHWKVLLNNRNPKSIAIMRLIIQSVEKQLKMRLGPML